MNDEAEKLAKKLLAISIERKLTIATAESCTGGLIAAAFTSIAGSSQSFSAGLVCYSNRAKIKLLGVDRDLLKKHGAVSVECALAMAQGAIEKTGAGLALSSTGIAGPSGGSAERPIGLVYIGASLATSGSENIICEFGDIGRDRIRKKAVIEALRLGLRLVE